MEYGPEKMRQGGMYMSNLTHRELLLLQDNIGMCQDTAQFIQASVNNITDPEFKGICQQMIKEHQQGSQMLAKHIMQASTQQ